MSTAAVAAGGSVRVATVRRSVTMTAVAAGTAVVMANTLSNVGNNGRRGTNWLPTVLQPIGWVEMPMPDGSMKRLPVQIDDQYYRFFDEFAERRLGGVKGQSIVDVSTNATAAIQGVTTISQTVSAIGQQSDAAAAAAETSKQVLVAAGVPNAGQIPPVPRRDVAVE